MRKFRAKNLCGMKFGKLTVISLHHIENKRRVFACKCDCGNQEEILVMGCALRNGKRTSCGCSFVGNDLTGQKFGLLTVLGFNENIDGQNYWLCQCGCEKQKIISVKGNSLITFNTMSCGCRKYKDWTGFTNNRLTVINYAYSKNKKAYWNCKCECGNEWVVSGKDLKRTQSCGCWKKDATRKGFGDLSGLFWKHLKNNASRRELEFSLNEEYCWNLFLEQDKKCALTGLPIIMEREYLKNRETHTASLDRIDNSKGYVKGNVRWVHWRVNLIKNDMSDEEMYFYCKNICSVYEEKLSYIWKDSEDTSYICSI